ncbi:MAG: hypothetical protein K6A98_06725 [Prevotella sp.]|jgi:hypothetical protein|nr:hypothetical protein [Prevotella sp.]MCR5152827.1 hypothetical protein [Prevotella sp.]
MYTDINGQPTAIQPYKSLSDLRLRKEMLRSELRKDDKKMQKMWNSLFHKPEKTALTPSSRIAGLMSTGAGILDGLILGWKLYRKFKRKK